MSLDWIYSVQFVSGASNKRIVLSLVLRMGPEERKITGNLTSSGLRPGKVFCELCGLV
jgi:hypothetical protein